MIDKSSKTENTNKLIRSFGSFFILSIQIKRKSLDKKSYIISVNLMTAQNQSWRC